MPTSRLRLRFADKIGTMLVDMCSLPRLVRNISGLAGILLFAQLGSAQVKPDVIIFDEDDAIGAGYYDASVPSVTPPSVLTTASSDRKSTRLNSSHGYI